jgi:rare lipoprotein A (peptidoglycan hydrolase)
MVPSDRIGARLCAGQTREAEVEFALLDVVRRIAVTLLALGTCLALLLGVSAEGPAWATPGASASAPPSPSASSTLDAATREALALQDRIDRDQEDITALEERIALASMQVFQQSDRLAHARSDVDAARTRFQSRLIGIYKSQMFNPVVVLMESKSLADFYTRFTALSTIARRDQRILSDARLAEAQAAYEAEQVDAARTQLVSLRSLKQRSITDEQAALVRQKALVATLTEQAKAVLAAKIAQTAATRVSWRKSSVPLGTPIRYVPGVVDPYAQPFLVSEFQPKHYKATGRTFRAVCSWYGNADNPGSTSTASGQLFNERDFTCASRTLPFGTRLALTRGSRRIVVVVTDRGPYIAGRDLDLSKYAAATLGFSGVEPVQAEFVEVVP